MKERWMRATNDSHGGSVKHTCQSPPRQHASPPRAYAEKKGNVSHVRHTGGGDQVHVSQSSGGGWCECA
jgi:hypothetical protein